MVVKLWRFFYGGGWGPLRGEEISHYFVPRILLLKKNVKILESVRILRKKSKSRLTFIPPTVEFSQNIILTKTLHQKNIIQINYKLKSIHKAVVFKLLEYVSVSR